MKYWDWLDARHVAGVIIIGLLFGAMAILGMTVQIYGELPADASSGKTIKAYFRYSAQIGGFLIILLGSMAALVILTWKLLVPLAGLWGGLRGFSGAFSNLHQAGYRGADPVGRPGGHRVALEIKDGKSEKGSKGVVSTVDSSRS